MDIQATKIELAKMILSIESPAIVNKVLALLKSEQADFWNELSEEDKAEVMLGMEQLDAGQRISFDDFLKKVS